MQFAFSLRQIAIRSGCQQHSAQITIVPSFHYPCPQFHRIMATSRVASPSMFSQQFWTRCTIYNRHEQRRACTLQLRDDPRPAVVRVLSGLPGFRAVIPPFVPSATTAAVAAVAASGGEPSSLLSNAATTTTVSFHTSNENAATAASQQLQTGAPLVATSAAGLFLATAAAFWNQSSTAAAAARPVCHQTILLQQGRVTSRTIPLARSRRAALVTLPLVAACEIARRRQRRRDSSTNSD